MGQRFDLPSSGGIDLKLQEVQKSIQDSRTLTLTSQRQLKNYLKQINQISGGEDPNEQISTLEVYKWFVAKEKTLGLFGAVTASSSFQSVSGKVRVTFVSKALISIQ